MTHLTVEYSFNQKVDATRKNVIFDGDNLPLTQTHLTFGENFDQLVNNLQNILTQLAFGCYFNQTVDATRKNKIFAGAPKTTFFLMAIIYQ